jgi:hypothetical protein
MDVCCIPNLTKLDDSSTGVLSANLGTGFSAKP